MIAPALRAELEAARPGAIRFDVDASRLTTLRVGGVADALQLWNRPVTRLDPYSTPNPRLFLCSAATPPGGGVHGMCGFWAARSALRTLRR